MQSGAMTTEEIASLHQQFVMPVYEPDIALVKGRGTMVWDAEGRGFLDFISGMAVTNLGHCHPKITCALKDQAANLIHVSNLFYNEQQPQLAQELARCSGWASTKCFFCNSGAEANEGLIKIARLWGSRQGRHEIITMHQSFHGRTLATLTATGQKKVQRGFGPLPKGFVYADYNDLTSVEALIKPTTAAVMVEALQGEGGVVPSHPDFLPGLRQLCDAYGILLLCDEVQTGIGRTGRWFGFQNYDVEPDAFSLAKGLGNGFPIGAIVVGAKLADTFQPGDHATTFGGAPLGSAAALAVLHAIRDEGLLERARERGSHLMKGLETIAAKYPEWIKKPRGIGLMVGLPLKVPAMPLQQALLEKGLLVITTTGTVLRMLPPLIVTAEELDQALGWVEEACGELNEDMLAQVGKKE